MAAQITAVATYSNGSVRISVTNENGSLDGWLQANETNDQACIRIGAIIDAQAAAQAALAAAQAATQQTPVYITEIVQYENGVPVVPVAPVAPAA